MFALWITRIVQLTPNDEIGIRRNAVGALWVASPDRYAELISTRMLKASFNGDTSIDGTEMITTTAIGCYEYLMLGCIALMIILCGFSELRCNLFRMMQ